MKNNLARRHSDIVHYSLLTLTLLAITLGIVALAPDALASVLDLFGL